MVTLRSALCHGDNLNLAPISRAGWREWWMAG